MPSQQGWASPPQASQPLPVQTEPDAVQKSLPRAAWQQLPPTSPQSPQAEVAAVQVPKPPVQAAPPATQIEPEQQPAPQVEFSQQGWVAPPQATKVPAWQTRPEADPVPPAGTQRLVAVSRQAPAWQPVAPEQGAW